VRKSVSHGLEEEIRSELARLGGAPRTGGDLTELVRAWPRCVGPAISSNAWPARLSRDGSLLVHVSSSTWAFELTQLEEEIRARLGALAPPRLKFVPGPLPEGDEHAPTPRDAPAIRPDARAKATSLAAEIADPTLRELVAKAASISLSKGAGGNEATGPSGKLERR
jgi:hypothetical protein